MSSDETVNYEANLALEFALYTNRSLFLTGKAGTGKTTLLKKILQKTTKNIVVLAPTGVAAINAEGVTIHSFFTFPLQTFIPIKDSHAPRDLFCDRTMLVKHQKYSSEKRQILLELDTLIIDEISMVRADLLDAIDFTLRRFRKNNQPFGGVQLIAIGDLFQLAPVVRRESEHVLSQFYKSAFFFDSMVWKELSSITIELKKVYRQEEHAFVEILNNIREGLKKEEDIKKLNDRYRTNFDSENIIHLTTHNKKADKINQDKLGEIKHKTQKLEAKVDGKFPENSYPAKQVIELKKDAQVMFIRNHSEGLYFNGKIGKITEIGESFIKVKAGENNHTILLEPIEWTNSKYTVDKKTNEVIKEDIGTFVQYPVKLAWAVTVHKSQGLTFDEVILDLEDTFTYGQLYVALSRCRSLQGLTLSSHISSNNIIVNKRILQFYKDEMLPENIQEILEFEKNRYEDHHLLKQFVFTKLLSYTEMWEQMITEKEIPEQADCLLLCHEITDKLKALDIVSARFRKQLYEFLASTPIPIEQIIERSEKAILYFSKEMHQNILIRLEDHISTFSKKKGTIVYLREVSSVLNKIWNAIEGWSKLSYRKRKILDTPLNIKRKKLDVDVDKKKRIKGETYKITLEMFNDGKSMEAIAKERSMAVSTIEGHMSRHIQHGAVSIFDLMKENKVKKLSTILQQNEDLGFNELIVKIPGKVSFSELRWVKAHLEKE